MVLYKALGGGWEIRAGNPVVDQDTADQMIQRTNWGKLLDPAQVPDEVSLPAPASDQPLFGTPD